MTQKLLEKIIANWGCYETRNYVYNLDFREVVMYGKVYHCYQLTRQSKRLDGSKTNYRLGDRERIALYDDNMTLIMKY